MTQLTDADYEINMEVLMGSMGIEPGTVAADTAKVQFLNGKAVLTYTAMRAIPTRVLGVALLRSAKAEEPQPVPEPEMPTLLVDKTPDGTTISELPKKATGRRPVKKSQPKK